MVLTVLFQVDDMEEAARMGESMMGYENALTYYVTDEDGEEV